MIVGYVKPYNISYKIHQYDTPFEYKDNSYWISLQFCWGLFTYRKFNPNYTADFRTLTGYKHPSPFGRNWKGWYVQFLGFGIMLKKEIK